MQLKIQIIRSQYKDTRKEKCKTISINVHLSKENSYKWNGFECSRKIVSLFEKCWRAGVFEISMTSLISIENWKRLYFQRILETTALRALPAATWLTVGRRLEVYSMAMFKAISQNTWNVTIVWNRFPP